MIVEVKLKNCYGIKALNYKFDFGEDRACLIYASNGTMKTSLAKVFRDHSTGGQPKDRIFTERVSEYSITDDTGKNIDPNQILVIDPFDEDFSSERVATLLANDKLKREYEKINVSIDKAKSELLSRIVEMSGFKSNADIEQIIVSVFNISPNSSFYSWLDELEVDQNKDLGFHDIQLAELSNDKVDSFLSDKDNLRLIQEYTDKYNELISKSKYFQKGKFDDFNADEISKSLVKNGFLRLTIQLT